MRNLITCIFIALAMPCILSGCLSDNPPVVELYQKPTLDVALPDPLQLAPVQWKVLNVGPDTYYALAPQDFTNLANDLESIQNRTSLYYHVIGSQKQYYETPIPTK